MRIKHPMSDDASQFCSGECFHCRGRSAGMWMGSNGPVEVCGACAVQVLPALIADATADRCRGPQGVSGAQMVLKEVEAAYWKAVAASAAAELRARDRIKAAVPDDVPAADDVLTGMPASRL